MTHLSGRRPHFVDKELRVALEYEDTMLWRIINLCQQNDVHDQMKLHMYSVEQKNGVRGCYRSGSCWHTVFLHSTVYV